MIKAIKFRLYPSDKNSKIIDSFIHTTRFVYNLVLENFKKIDKEGNKIPHWMKVTKQLVQLKNQEKYSFIKDCDSRSIEYAAKYAFENTIEFLKGNRGEPRFKSKKSNVLSYYAYNRRVYIKNKNYIQLPKIGLVKIKNSYNLEDKHWINCTISKTKSNKYYISLTYEDDSIGKQPFHIRRNKVGIDVGIRTLCTFNDGTKIDPPKFYKQSANRIRGLQKSLARKTSGSNNYEKARIKLNKAYEKDHNRLQNFIHNLSKHIVDQYDEIHIEDYNAFKWGQTKMKNINKACLYSGLGELKRQLIYKSEWYDKELIIADKSYPSSQLCSNCGYQYKETKYLKLTEWDCPNCGFHHDRDVNAAINLVNYYPC